MTEELRKGLDERGVKWSVSFYPDSRFTRWESRGVVWTACDLDDGILLNSNNRITPEDVIAATVGNAHDLTDLWEEWERVLFANVQDEVAQDNLNECFHVLLEKAATMGRESDGSTMVKLHDQMNAALFEYERIQGIENRDGDGETVVPFVAKMHSLLEKAATVGAATCHITVKDNLAETEGMGDVWLECDECHWQMPLEPTTPRFSFCPNCGKRIEVDE